MVPLPTAFNSRVSDPACQLLDSELLHVYAHVVTVGQARPLVKTPLGYQFIGEPWFDKKSSLA